MAKFGIGQAVRRVEDQRFITGHGRYIDDINVAGQAYGALLLSPHAHARIIRIETTKAKAAPGVLAVLTGADAVADKLGSLTAHLMPEDVGAPKGHRTFQPLLVADRVRFAGDRVAYVVAETVARYPWYRPERLFGLLDAFFDQTCAVAIRTTERKRRTGEADAGYGAITQDPEMRMAGAAAAKRDVRQVQCFNRQQ